MAVWADDPSTPEVEGLKDGETFTLALLSDNKSSNRVLEIVRILEGEGLVYQTDEFTAVEAAVCTEIPATFYLTSNFPNPFNASTRIVYGLASDALIKIAVYDLAGHLVTILYEGKQEAGNHQIVWHAGDTASGLYFIRLNAQGVDLTNKMFLVR